MVLSSPAVVARSESVAPRVAEVMAALANEFRIPCVVLGAVPAVPSVSELAVAFPLMRVISPSVYVPAIVSVPLSAPVTVIPAEETTFSRETVFRIVVEAAPLMVTVPLRTTTDVLAADRVTDSIVAP